MKRLTDFINLVTAIVKLSKEVPGLLVMGCLILPMMATPPDYLESKLPSTSLAASPTLPSSTCLNS